MGTVNIWEETVIIPTYEVGEADKNPMFLEKRVYQGSSGKVYPYPTIEKIYDTKIDKEYRAVWLENEYLKIMILPELGGRIQRALDKTNQYDFVYYNHVIKPALVGLCGPWISGGIEFNWPQHHRPTTYSPVDYMLIDHEDGSKTCRVCDVDQMNGTKGEASFTLHPGKAYIEIRGQLYNRTPMPQTFLWWANPAVPVNDYTQSVFPPDVHAVMDHGKRDVSRFPMATGVYYKHDYSEGVDISRYKNIPVPTSYMAEKSEFDFVGGYDYNVGAGILHVADHQISPGKKQWTWGNGDFGKAWDKNLTDEDGPYVELMTGVFTDNQPDFTWLKPMEEKTFTQYFMPYKAVGYVKNATTSAVVNLETTKEQIHIAVYGTSEYSKVKIKLTNEKEVLLEEETSLSPVHIYEKTLPPFLGDETKLLLQVMDGEKELVSYRPVKKEVSKLPEPAKAAEAPKDIKTNEELFLTGLHIEQYRHATYQPDEYYLEGLKRDPGDIRINNAYGALLMRRGCFGEAENYFRIAIERAVWKNPNPYDSEPYYNLGLALYYQRKLGEAFDAFFKATWSNEQQEMSYYYLACIESINGNYENAIDLAEKGLVKNSHNIKVRALIVWLLRKLGRTQEALKAIEENLKIDSFDYVSRMEWSYLDPTHKAEIQKELFELTRGYHENYLMIARDYGEFGAYEEAVNVLSCCTKAWPLIHYYKAYYENDLGMDATDELKKAEDCSTDYCFPNKLEDILVLKFSIVKNPAGANAYYYLGNLFYDKMQYSDATAYWEKAVSLKPEFPITWRNLSLAYYNKMGEKEKARMAMEKAYSLNTMDARIFLELDQLYKKLGMLPKVRLQRYEAAREIFMQRDDLMIEYATLLNLEGRYKESLEFIMSHKFHPWEGGEGKVTTQYVTSLVELARKALAAKDWDQAEMLLKKALVYPDNLGEGKLEGTKDNHIHYYLGIVMEQTGRQKEAEEFFEIASTGTLEPAGMMYYNDQPADMIYYQGLSMDKLKKSGEAKKRFYKLLDYGEQHMSDEIKIDYFAVSLPDFLIYEENLDQKNKVHCKFLIGLGKMGLGDFSEARKELSEAIHLDPSHLNAVRCLSWIEER